MEHRPAPHDRRVLLDEETDRHDADSILGHQRNDFALGVDPRPLGTDAQHPRLRVAPHVGVEDAHLLALGGQRRGQIGGHARLADAPLAGADADHVRDLRQRALGEPAAAQLARQRRLFVVRQHVERHVHARHALELVHGLRNAGLEVAPDRATRRRQGDHHVNHPVRMHIDRPDHLQLDDVAPKLGVDHRAQGTNHLVLGGHGSHCRRGPCLAEQA